MNVDIVRTSTDTATIAECLKQHPDVAMSKDSNGNIEIVSGRKIFYDYENRPIRIITSEGSESTYVYDHEGNRVIKNVDGVRTTYIGTIYEETADETIEYIHAGNQRVALKSSRDGVLYFHTDHLGSTNKMTDSSGAVVRETKYNPYGSVFANAGSKDNDHRFTGQRSDDPTGLYYYGARYYDPGLGIFLTPDTIVQSPYDPQLLNRYTYCRDNPINLVDPDGHFVWFIPILIGAAIGAVSGGTHGFQEWNHFDWNAAATGAAVGAVSGAAALGAAAGMGALGAGGLGLCGDILTGAVAGGVAGGAGYTAGTALTGATWDGGTFFSAMGMGAAVGGVLGGATSGHLGKFLKGEENFLGKVSASKLPSGIAKTFRDGDYKHIKLENDSNGKGRFWGGESNENGQYLTTRHTMRQITSPSEAQRMLNLPAGNTAKNLTIFKIPKGTDVYIGRVEGGGATATQIYIKSGKDFIYQERIVYDPPIRIDK